jgi:hypothetical protein
MHFFLPYAVIADHQEQLSHAPPHMDRHESNEDGQTIEELPHHIEAQESELEEVDEDQNELFLLPNDKMISMKKTPLRAIFVLNNSANTLFIPMNTA